MKPNLKLTRRAAVATALGLAVFPVLAATSATARGGPDPWRPKRKTPTEGQTRPGAPRQR